jgi:hypothetical protein
MALEAENSIELPEIISELFLADAVIADVVPSLKKLRFTAFGTRILEISLFVTSMIFF